MWIIGSKNLSQFLREGHIEFTDIEEDLIKQNDEESEEQSLESSLIVKGEVGE